MSAHYRDVISYQLKIWVAILAGCWIYWKANVPIPLILVFLANILFSVLNTINVVSGKPYRHISIFNPGGKRDNTK